jgi:hypothetical protein
VLGKSTTQIGRKASTVVWVVSQHNDKLEALGKLRGTMLARWRNSTRHSPHVGLSVSGVVRFHLVEHDKVDINFVSMQCAAGGENRLFMIGDTYYDEINENPLRAVYYDRGWW